ncbi:MAG: hypothetical protein ABSA93_16980 [Streptosporangiaceae bacterium]|jgi:hypothetical protein
MTDSVTHPGSGLRLRVPARWESVLDAGAPVVLAFPIEPGQTPHFRPNIVATVERTPPAMMDVAAYTDASLEGMRRMLTGFQVIAIDPATIDGHEGRRVLCAYRSGIYALATEHWWTVALGVATTLTASCQVEDYLDLAPVFEDVAAAMVPATRVPGGPG